MAEGRMLKKRISKSHKFAALKTHNARLLYMMMYPHLDIKGRLDADPTLIKGEITPLLNFSQQKIWEYLQDMHNVGLVKLYKANGQWYLETTRFFDFQSLRPNHEADSQCPDPTTDQLPELDGTTTAKVKESKVKESKSKYSTHVLLSSSEYEKLVSKLGEQQTKRWIEELDLAIASKGYKYKSHYATILNWHRRKYPPSPLKSPADQEASTKKQELKRQQQRAELSGWLQEKSVQELKVMRVQPFHRDYWFLIDEILKVKQ